MPAQSPVSPPRFHSRVVAAAKYAVAVLLLAAAYLFAGKVGLSLATVHPSVTTIWPPSGIAMGALALFGYRLWPGAWLGAFLLFYDQSGNIESSLGIACGNTAEALLGAWFLGRLGGALAFERASRMMGFLGGCGLLSCALAATVGVASLSRLGLSESSPPTLVWLTWWVGDSMSVWIVVPFLVLGKDFLDFLRARHPSVRPARIMEAAGVLLTLIAGELVAFGGILPDPYKQVPMAFTTLPTLIWVSMRFGPFGTSSVLVIHAGIAVWGTLRGYGQFADEPTAYVLLQSYLAVGIFIFQLMAVVVASRDRAVMELRASESRINEIIQSLPGVVWESWGDPSSADYKVTFVSDQSERLFGYSSADWLSHPELLWGRIHPEDIDRVKRDAIETYAGKWSGTSQFRIHARNGRPVDVEMRMVVMRDLHGAPIGMRGFNLDVTDRVKSERLLREVEDQLRESQKMEAVGRLAGGIAHDYNNILTTIIGYSDLITGAAPKEGPISGYASEIRNAGARGADLTRQLLTFSRQDVVQSRLFDLNGLVAEQERRMVSMLGEDVRLGLTLEPGPLKIRVDPHHLERILFNLVCNARDAMPRGGVIKVETSYRERVAVNSGFYLEPGPGPHIVLSVNDSGMGIPQEAMGHLFEPFYTTKGHIQSVGLGLPTVYGIVKRYGGGIRVESKVGEGARFEVLLPAVGAEPVPEGVGRAGSDGLFLEG